MSAPDIIGMIASAFGVRRPLAVNYLPRGVFLLILPCIGNKDDLMIFFRRLRTQLSLDGAGNFDTSGQPVR